MPSKKDLWQTVSLHPLSGSLDTRSRPADIVGGAFRWKQNFSISPDAKLCRRAGHEKFYSDSASFTNHDYHRQGRTRDPVTFQFESTASDGTRRYFVGTKTSVSRLNHTTGLYTDIVTGKGGVTDENQPSRWSAAELQDTLILTNDIDDILAHDLSGDTASTIGDLKNVLHVTKARIAVQFSGFMVLMNVFQDGERKSSRIIWSDLNLPKSYDPAATSLATDGSTVISSIAGFQDLNYGDDILAAAPMLGYLYIYTRRSIWRMSVAGDATSVFSFNQVYQEPRNQSGCLAYANTLVNTGTEHWYMGNDGIYNFSPFLPAPERQDWMYRASGVIYRKTDTQIDTNYCASPVAEYAPSVRELWISWPSQGNSGINNWCLVAQLEHKTADVIDAGYTSLVNFRRGGIISGKQECSQVQEFLGASGRDWCIKSIGGAFYREFVVLSDPNDPTVDTPLTAEYTQEGYNSILRTIIPLGLTDRDKLVRKVLLDHDTSTQDIPCVIRLRIGNSQYIVDPNDTEDICAPQWRVIRYNRMTTNPALACQDSAKLSELAAKNRRPAIDLTWQCYEQGRFLYFEMTIQNADGTPAIGGDTCFQRIDFDALALPKP